MQTADPPISLIVGDRSLSTGSLERLTYGDLMLLCSSPNFQDHGLSAVRETFEAVRHGLFTGFLKDAFHKKGETYHFARIIDSLLACSYWVHSMRFYIRHTSSV